MEKRLILLLSVLLLLGCQTKYTYIKKTSEGDICYLTIESSREFKAGQLNLTEECAIKGSGSDIKQSDKTLKTLTAIIGTALNIVK